MIIIWGHQLACLVSNIFNKPFNIKDLCNASCLEQHFLSKMNFVYFKKYQFFHFPLSSWQSYWLELNVTIACPKVLLPALPSLPLSDWQLSIVLNHQHLTPPPFQSIPSRLWGTWCLVLHYQMARQMTSPCPHYTRTHRHNTTVSEQTRRGASQHTNSLNGQMNLSTDSHPQTSTHARIHW